MPLSLAARPSISDAERKQLVDLGPHRSSPRYIVLRINIVLGAAEGLANLVLARTLFHFSADGADSTYAAFSLS
jgi:hypothetical protein